MEIIELLKAAVDKQASDIFLVTGAPVAFKIDGSFVNQTEERRSREEILELIRGIYRLAERDSDEKTADGDDDFAFSIPSVSRFRAGVFRQRGTLAAVIRIISFELPDYSSLHLPKTVVDLSRLTKGMVLVTGPAGSGKSTTLSCIINEINNSRNAHIITLEDPIEYLYRHKMSIVSQREIGTDTASYISGLTAALRHSPDVILLGEMRDAETIRTAMTAAETGHLVLSTLHTVGAANTVDRIVDSFPASQQQQIRTQIAMVLRAVVSQQLVPAADGGQVPAFEIMFFNNAVRNLVREAKLHQIDNVIQTSQNEGMVSMDSSLLRLYQEGIITRENAVIYSSNAEIMEKRLAAAGKTV